MTVRVNADLRRCGLKNTRRRNELLGILERGDRPMAAEEMYTALRAGGVAIHLSTVYRTLDILAGKDLIRKLSLPGDGRALYERAGTGHRHYLVCLDCKKILPVGRCPLEDYEKTLEEETHFAISGHQLDVYGYCPECAGRGERG